MTTTPITTNRFSPLQSQHQKGQFTDSHNTALGILSHNRVSYLAEEVIPIPNEFDFYGRPVSYKVDILIHDRLYGSGVININGEAHDSALRIKRDEIRTARLIRMGFWVEDIANDDVTDIMDVLGRHKREVLDYP